MNNKGIVPALLIPAAIAILILVVGLVAGFKVLFSTSYLFYGIGILVLVLSFIYVLPAAMSGDFNKQKRNFLFLMLLLGVAFIALPLTGITQSTLGYTYIEVPTHGYYECAPSGEAKMSDAKAIPGLATNVQCPANTDKCTIIVSTTDSQSLFSTKSIMFTVFDSNNNVIQTKTDLSFQLINYQIGTIPSVSFELLPLQHASIGYFKKGLFSAGFISGATYRAQYKPYILWDNTGLGGRFEATTTEVGCEFKE